MKIFALDSFRMPRKRQREKTLQMCPWWKGKLLAAMLTATISVLSGCTALGPDYQSPKAKLPEAWMSPIAHGGEQVGLQNWWAQFEDETLLDLIRAAEADSPNLQRALASIDSARANLGTTRSARWPSLNGTGRVNRMRQLGGAGGGSIDATSAEGGADSMVATYGTRSAGFDASWELDLFGKIIAIDEDDASGLSSSTSVSGINAGRTLQLTTKATKMGFGGCLPYYDKTWGLVIFLASCFLLFPAIM